MKAWRLVAAAALLVAGLIGGTVLDPVPDRAPVLRGSYRVLEVDFHAHTRFSDGLLSPFDLVLQARRRGLDVLAVTEHNLIFPAELARWYARAIGGPEILVGEEVTTSRYHLHGIGLTARIDASAPLERVIDDVHGQGGVVIAAHPVRRFWPALVPVRDRLDGTEVMHPLAYSSRPEGGAGVWRWEEMRDFYLEAEAAGHPLAAIGASDYHFFSTLGVCRTQVLVPADTAPAALGPAVLDAIRARRTIVHDLDGRAYGAIDLLAGVPVELRPQDYRYAGTGTADRVFAILGWLGMLALVSGAPRRS